jgi:hypothetical protein
MCNEGGPRKPGRTEIGVIRFWSVLLLIIYWAKHKMLFKNLDIGVVCQK